MLTAPEILNDPGTTTVISVLPRRLDSPDTVLFGIRTATPTSSRHDNVLSTLTMRVPSTAMLDALNGCGVPASGLSCGSVVPVPRARSYPIGRRDTLAAGPSFLVESLLCRKLDLSTALVTGRFSGAIRAAAIAYDVVHDEESDPSAEPTFMLTMVLDIESGAEEIPRSTASYSRLAWVPIDRVHDAVRNRDPLDLVPDADPFAVCLHGLCVRSAAGIVAGPGSSDW